jgi:hypothetical protein
LASKADTTYVDSQIGAINVSTVSTTAPSSPAAGDMWFDTTSGTTAMKVWSGSEWNQMSNKFSATGGTETTYSSGGVSYKVHTFTSSGTFTAEASGTVDVLVVAGGGSGGGGYYSGGGAAGGAYMETGVAVTASNYLATIGAGGAGGGANGTGSPGANTSFGAGIVCIGGGRGGHDNNNGTSGGNGGGAGGSGSSSHGTGAVSGNQPGNKPPYFGSNSGGNRMNAWDAGAGGGANGAGADGTGSANTGLGGDGLQCLFRTGSNQWYATGGSGVTHNAYDGYKDRKNGIAGQGCMHHSATADLSKQDASVNSGAGGGGGDRRNAGYVRSGQGGSGIVIVRYAV